MVTTDGETRRGYDNQQQNNDTYGIYAMSAQTLKVSLPRVRTVPRLVCDKR